VGNDVELLVDGQDTFDSIFEGIQRAERYILVQFYILRGDGLGKQLNRRLADKARQGVQVYVLYDEIGSHDLPDTYVSEMAAAGIQAYPFNTTKGRANRFQINFRNHRKIVVVDGKEAWVGGHNVGDEYLGKDPKSGPWRDTHMRVCGPVAQAIQLTFAEDWHWASGAMLDLEWQPTPCASGRQWPPWRCPPGRPTSWKPAPCFLSRPFRAPNAVCGLPAPTSCPTSSSSPPCSWLCSREWTYA
jgi:cardiolipin synthase